MDPTATTADWIAALPLIDPRDRERLARAAEAVEPVLEPNRLTAVLTPGANDTFTDLLVVGWAKGALDAIRADSVMRDKRITWIVRSGQARWLAEALRAAPAAPGSLAVAVCDDHAEMPTVLERLTVCWSLAILDESLCPHEQALNLGRTRLLRGRGSMTRIVGDTRHLWDRLERLGDAVPLAAWKSRYAGQSALCLAAGPTLDKHLPFIREHMHRCVVIVVDVLQKRLQDAGIKVDYVVTVDSDARVNQRMVAPTDPSTVLVMPLLGHRELDAKFALRSHFGFGVLARWLLGPDCVFSTGTTVGIASVGLAEFLGCRDAVLIGHDLSFEEEAYYSEFVAGREEHARDMLAEARMMARRVPRNGGGTVATDYLFEVAIQDLGLLLSPRRLAAYNLNANAAVAAVLPGTQALPDGWRPAADEPLARPAADRRLRDEGLARDLRRVVRERVTSDVANALAMWPRLRADGCSEVIIDERLRAESSTAIGMQLLHPFFNGGLLHYMRLSSLPPSISTAWHKREALRFIDQALASAVAFLDRLFGDAEVTIDDAKARMPYEDGQRRFFLSLYAGISEASDSPAESILAPMLASALRDVRLALPELGLPPPQSAISGLRAVRAIGDLAPTAFIVQTLCLCALEDLVEPTEWARRTRLVPEDQLPDAARAGETVEVRATNAVLRIRAGSSRSLKADARAAAAWPPAHVHLVRALVARGADGVTACEKLLRAGEVAIDDQIAALVLLHVPDIGRASAMVHPQTARLGEASVIALAQRQLELGQLAQADKTARGIRPLSRFRDAALAIVADCALARGDADGAAAAAGAMTSLDQRARWRHRLDRAAGRWRDNLARILAETRLPDPDEIAWLLEQAWKASDAPAIDQLLRLLAVRPRESGGIATAADYRTLAEAATTMLARLRVASASAGAEAGGLAGELARWIADRFNAGRPVGADESLIYGGMIDSLGFAELACFLAERVGRPIEARELLDADVDTIAQIAAHVG